MLAYPQPPAGRIPSSLARVGFPDATVLERLIAAGISGETAHEDLAVGMVHVDGVQVTDLAVPADKPATIVLRSSSQTPIALRSGSPSWE